MMKSSYAQLVKILDYTYIKGLYEEIYGQKIYKELGKKVRFPQHPDFAFLSKSQKNLHMSYNNLTIP